MDFRIGSRLLYRSGVAGGRTGHEVKILVRWGLLAVRGSEKEDSRRLETKRTDHGVVERLLIGRCKLRDGQMLNLFGGLRGGGGGVMTGRVLLESVPLSLLLHVRHFQRGKR